MNVLSIMLQAAGGGANYGWVMMIAIVAIFYFFMIRPQQKKQKDLQRAREAMQVGDKVITSGGIYGKIKKIEETSFIIEIANDVLVKIDKASVFAVSNGK